MSKQFSTETNPRRISVLRSIGLTALTIACWTQIFFSAVHLDLARDIFIAWRLLQGVEIPLRGPILAEAIHLGPLYYWLLGLLLAPTRSWIGAVALLGLLASLKVPLAYLAGKELHSRRAGFLFSIGLFVPCWGTFEWLFPGHNLLTTPLTLAFLLCAARYFRNPRRRYLIAMASIFVVALHAHPTTLSLACIGLALLVWAGWNHRLRAADMLLAGAIGLIPLVPYFVSDAAHGFADIRSGSHYLGSGSSTGHLAAMLPILQATAFGGTRYWFATVLGWPPEIADAACVLISLSGVLGIGGALYAAVREPRQRILVAAAFCALFFILLSTALIRNVTPYYQTVVLRTVLTGIVAVGLASFGETVSARLVRLFTVVVVAISYSTCLTAAIRFQTHGDWPFSFFPLFNVIGESQPAAAFLALPSYAIGDSGKFLCASQSPSTHGLLAQQLLHDYAMDMRLACDRSNVKLGGADANREHWLGLSRASLMRLGVTPARYFGPMGILAAHPLAFGNALDPQASPIYPAYAPDTVEPQTRRLHLQLDADAHLAISNIAWSFVPNPEVSVTIDGKPAAPSAEDSVARVYACTGCTSAQVDIEIRSIDPGDVDVVTF